MQTHINLINSFIKEGYEFSECSNGKCNSYGLSPASSYVASNETNIILNHNGEDLMNVDLRDCTISLNKGTYSVYSPDRRYSLIKK